MYPKMICDTRSAGSVVDKILDCHHGGSGSNLGCPIFFFHGFYFSMYLIYKLSFLFSFFFLIYSVTQFKKKKLKKFNIVLSLFFVFYEFYFTMYRIYKLSFLFSFFFLIYIVKK